LTNNSAVHLVTYNFGVSGMKPLVCVDRNWSIAFLCSCFMNMSNKFETMSIAIQGQQEPFDGFSLDKFGDKFLFTVINESEKDFSFGFWALKGEGSEEKVPVPNAEGFRVPAACMITESELLPVIRDLYSWSTGNNPNGYPKYKKGQWYEWSFEKGYG